MKPQSFVLVGCFLFCVCVLLPRTSAQGTGKVQEFFKKYFGEYFPKTTRSYTLYGNALNGPADFNAGLPIPEDHEGTINSIIVRRGGKNGNQQQNQAMAPPGMNNPNAWQPMSNFAPYAANPGGHRGRSDLPDELEERQEEEETPIITAEDLLGAGDNEMREIQMESSMSFAPGSVN